jgi:hypothetical protein
MVRDSIIKPEAHTESLFTNGWHVYTLRSDHHVDFGEERLARVGQKCAVRFRTYATGNPCIEVRFFKVDVPKKKPPEQDPLIWGTGNDEYSRLYSPRRHQWFFPGIEKEKLVREAYEGRLANGKPTKIRMSAF